MHNMVHEKEFTITLFLIARGFFSTICINVFINVHLGWIIMKTLLFFCQWFLIASVSEKIQKRLDEIIIHLHRKSVRARKINSAGIINQKAEVTRLEIGPLPTEPAC